MPPVPKPKAANTGRNRNLLIALGVAGIVALALIAGSIVLSRDGGGDATETSTSQGSTSAPVALVAGIPQSGMVLGNSAAKVRMVQWEDIQCPVCKVYNDEALPAIVDEYVRPGKVKLDFRGLAFLGPDSVKALRISLAAGLQNKLWEVVGLFFENQGAENSGWVTDDLVDEILAEVPGLDADKVKADADSATVTDQIEAAQAEATRLEVNGTPTFFIGVGEEPLYQIQPRDLIPSEFRPALDDALAP
jgi:protein-disulfide isomerase